MKVAMLMGSDSAWPILNPPVELLKQFGIESVVEVASLTGHQLEYVIS